jgi:hypothetical protein
MSWTNFKSSNLHGVNSNEFIYRLDGLNDLIIPGKEYDFFSSDTLGKFNKKRKFIYNQDPDPLIKYSLNSYGFRCDNFDKELVKDNFLYAGCSVTHGLGLPLNGSWAYQFNQMMGKSKYYNISVPGIGIEQIIWNIFTFIELFGNPKCIFVLLPCFNRNIKIIDYEDSFMVDLDDGEKFKNNNERILEFIKTYHILKILELYCASNNIRLVWSSWSNDIEKILKQSENFSFKNYFFMNDLDLFLEGIAAEKFMSKDIIEKPEELNNKYWNIARDDHHPGSQQQRLYALLFKEEYERRYEK